MGLGLFCCFADVYVGFCVVLFKGLVRDSPLGVCCASVCLFGLVILLLT